ncbi:uncharacterized protein LOC112056620 [Bicyclus anynana]|uniref:Uncharacterized protein LOC112056620 n=1 Tax=Bicyclus anynana TaxID=110368 RepID=A0A6J1P4X0_BICAN|nr:uncharacterized protein LOC112056620 [Bicyclus anynana]
MKFTIALLVVLATVASGAVIQGISRSNLSTGLVYPGDRLLSRYYLYQPARPNTIQYQDYVYRGNYSTRISAVTATEVGLTQYASAWILSGGVGYNSVTVRVQSAKGYGFYYAIDVWGR